MRPGTSTSSTASATGLRARLPPPSAVSAPNDAEEAPLLDTNQLLSDQDIERNTRRLRAPALATKDTAPPEVSPTAAIQSLEKRLVRLEGARLAMNVCGVLLGLVIVYALYNTNSSINTVVGDMKHKMQQVEETGATELIAKVVEHANTVWLPAMDSDSELSVQAAQHGVNLADNADAEMKRLHNLLTHLEHMVSAGIQIGGSHSGGGENKERSVEE